MLPSQKSLRFFDDRRDLIVPGNYTETVRYCTENLIDIATKAQKDRGFCSLALSGGSTPKAIFQLLTSPEYRERLDWSKILLFWSDERCVPPQDPDSNYHMAMDAGFASMPIPKENIFRMPADSPDLVAAAKEYEQTILKHVPKGIFDLVMLGMGEDGHTASLFPKTHGLHAEEGLVIANFIPQKNTWRMTLTYNCINTANHIAIYLIGKSKASMLKQVLTSPYNPDTLPIQRIGTRSNKALWIADNDAASEIKT